MWLVSASPKRLLATKVSLLSFLWTGGAGSVSFCGWDKKFGEGAYDLKSCRVISYAKISIVSKMLCFHYHGGSGVCMQSYGDCLCNRVLFRMAGRLKMLNCLVRLRRAELPLCVAKYHDMGMGSGGITPRILNRGTKWEWVFSLTPVHNTC
jgi:hypothetical protein